jgi:2-C-methyl-D-erythritol 4-phosphate cytidylyltransferase
MLDYFEMNRVIEELAKAYPAQCATTWFKITKNHKPSKEEYRDKVVEYMKQFEYLLATYPQCLETDKLKELDKKSLHKEIEKVLQGHVHLFKGSDFYSISSLLIHSGEMVVG